MTGRTAFPWREHRLLAAALALACLLTLVFALRLGHTMARWSERSALPVQGWMTLGFVANAWEVDRHRLAEALAHLPAAGEPSTLAAIAERSGRPLSEITDVLERTIAEEKPDAGE